MKQLNNFNIRNSINWRQILQVVFYVICIIYFVRWMWLNWNVVGFIWYKIQWGNILVSFILLSLSFLFRPIGMLVFFNGRQKKFNYLQSAHAYYGSQLAKYLPGGIWIFPSRLAIMNGMGAELGDSSLAITFEMIAMAIASLLVSVLALGTTLSSWCGGNFFVFLGIGCLGLGVVIVLFKIQLRGLLIAVFLYSVMWLLAGLSFHILVAALQWEGEFVPMSLTVGSFSFAWLVGFVSVFSPGGIGVREGVINILIGNVLPDPYPITIALFSRILWSLSEVIFFVLTMSISKYYKKTRQVDNLKQIEFIL